MLVTYGDVPMLTGATLADLVAAHEDGGHAVTVITADVADPTGYGRVLRDDAGHVAGIVEHKDADEAQRAITEINSGLYAFDAAVLVDALGRVGRDNAQGEMYLTDVLRLAREGGGTVAAHRIDDVWQTEGVNDRVQLARMGAELNRRVVEGWMREGVTVVDPATTWVDAGVTLARDVTLLPGVQLLGSTTVAEGATVGPDTTLRDCEVGPGASVVRSHGEGARIGAAATVGPFSFLRPGTVLGAKGKIGGFVETKNTVIGDGAKVPHLTYAGDADDRRGRQHRGRDDLRQLRRRREAPHGRRAAQLRRLRLGPGRARDDRRRRLRRGRLHRHRRRAVRRDRGRPRAAAQRRGLGRAPPRRHEDRRGGP